MQYKIVNGAVYYGGDMILENIDFELNDREKVAVVGRNGCGKTTLLKAISGEVILEEGTGEQGFNVIKTGRPTVSFLKQHPFEDNIVSMLDEILKVFSSLIDMENKMKHLLHILESSGDENSANEYNSIRERYAFEGGLTYKKEYLTMIKKFGFSDSDMQKTLSEFSGGQITKIAFIKMLLGKPDILLLDEPTNHLDIETVRWLEDYLKSYKSALVIVSHDRMFLDRIVDKVYEIEYGETHCYKGNYTAFETQKRENFIKQQKDHELQQAEIKRITLLIKKFRYKATKARMVQSKIKLLEHMKMVNAPDRFDVGTYHAAFQPEIESSKRVLFTENMEIGYSAPLAKINLDLKRGQRLGIIGGNGIGKSTLLKTLMGEIPCLSGKFQFGFNTHIGYFDQQIAQITGNETLFESFSKAYPALNDTEVRRALGAFMFSGDDVFRQISTLSGGEKVRLALCKLLHRRPNVLILDEPTNHMDIIGKETLENILTKYSGTVIFVSHDRYFVNKIADSLLVFGEGTADFLPETFREYEEHQKANIKIIEKDSAPAEIEKVVSKKQYASPQKEKARLVHRIGKLEEYMARCEDKLSGLNTKLQSPENYSDCEKISEIQAEIDKVNAELSLYMTEWEEKTIRLEDAET